MDWKEKKKVKTIPKVPLKLLYKNQPSTLFDNQFYLDWFFGIVSHNNKWQHTLNNQFLKNRSLNQDFISEEYYSSNQILKNLLANEVSKEKTKQSLLLSSNLFFLPNHFPLPSGKENSSTPKPFLEGKERNKENFQQPKKDLDQKNKQSSFNLKNVPLKKFPKLYIGSWYENIEMSNKKKPKLRDFEISFPLGLEKVKRFTVPKKEKDLRMNFWSPLKTQYPLRKDLEKNSLDVHTGKNLTGPMNFKKVLKLPKPKTETSSLFLAHLFSFHQFSIKDVIYPVISPFWKLKNNFLHGKSLYPFKYNDITLFDPYYRAYNFKNFSNNSTPKEFYLAKKKKAGQFFAERQKNNRKNLFFSQNENKFKTEIKKNPKPKNYFYFSEPNLDLNSKKFSLINSIVNLFPKKRKSSWKNEPLKNVKKSISLFPWSKRQSSSKKHHLKKKISFFLEKESKNKNNFNWSFSKTIGKENKSNSNFIYDFQEKNFFKKKFKSNKKMIFSSIRNLPYSIFCSSELSEKVLNEEPQIIIIKEKSKFRKFVEHYVSVVYAKIHKRVSPVVLKISSTVSKIYAKIPKIPLYSLLKMLRRKKPLPPRIDIIPRLPHNDFSLLQNLTPLKPNYLSTKDSKKKLFFLQTANSNKSFQPGILDQQIKDGPPTVGFDTSLKTNPLPDQKAFLNKIPLSAESLKGEKKIIDIGLLKKMKTELIESLFPKKKKKRIFWPFYKMKNSISYSFTTMKKGVYFVFPKIKPTLDLRATTLEDLFLSDHDSVLEGKFFLPYLFNPKPRILSVFSSPLLRDNQEKSRKFFPYWKRIALGSVNKKKIGTLPKPLLEKEKDPLEFCKIDDTKNKTKVFYQKPSSILNLFCNSNLIIPFNRSAVSIYSTKMKFLSSSFLPWKTNVPLFQHLSFKLFPDFVAASSKSNPKSKKDVKKDTAAVLEKNFTTFLEKKKWKKKKKQNQKLRLQLKLPLLKNFFPSLNSTPLFYDKEDKNFFQRKNNVTISHGVFSFPYGKNYCSIDFEKSYSPAFSHNSFFVKKTEQSAKFPSMSNVYKRIEKFIQEIKQNYFFEPAVNKDILSKNQKTISDDVEWNANKFNTREIENVKPRPYYFSGAFHPVFSFNYRSPFNPQLSNVSLSLKSFNNNYSKKTSTQGPLNQGYKKKKILKSKIFRTSDSNKFFKQVTNSDSSRTKKKNKIPTVQPRKIVVCCQKPHWRNKNQHGFKIDSRKQPLEPFINHFITTSYFNFEDFPTNRLDSIGFLFWSLLSKGLSIYCTLYYFQKFVIVTGQKFFLSILKLLTALNIVPQELKYFMKNSKKLYPTLEDQQNLIEIKVTEHKENIQNKKL